MKTILRRAFVAWCIAEFTIGVAIGTGAIGL
jgi:hypothetical protein